MKELVNINVGCVPILIITVILSLAIGVCSIVISMRDMDIFKRKTILIIFASLLFVCSVLLFLTPVFSKTIMTDTVKDLFGSVYYDGFYELKTSGSIWCGLLTLAASALIFAAPFIEEKFAYLDYIKAK